MILNRVNLDELQPDTWDIREGAVALVDKPLEWTSFDVVNKIRYALSRAYKKKRFKVGHAGTLDPMASGLVLILMGKATRLQDEYMKEDKIYEGVLELGYVTESFDREKEKVKYGEVEGITMESLKNTAEKFIGKIEQVPPVFSAIKVDGVPLYKYARSGKQVEVKTRIVDIYDFEIEDFNDNLVKFRVKCGSGTYIRSLAHDFGMELGCGAYLYDLRRVAIADYKIEDAVSINELVSVIDTRYKKSEEEI